MSAPVAVILSGARGSGKTSVCRELAESLRNCIGILCPAIMDADGGILGKLALCLATSESWVLARADAELGGPRTGKYSFSAAGIERAVACLRSALGASAASASLRTPLPQVCIVDEIGPLELDRGEGFAPVLPLLRSAGPLVVCARTGLEPGVAELLPMHGITRICLDAVGPGDTVRRMAELFGTAAR